MTGQERQAAKAKIIEKLAKKYFRVESVETRKSDGLDFYDVAIWSIVDALNEAFDLGNSYKPPAHTFTSGAEVIAAYGEPLHAKRSTLIYVREVSGDKEEFSYDNNTLTAIRGIDYVAVPVNNSGNPYPIKIDIFQKSWERIHLGVEIYRRSAISRIVQVPEGDTVVLKTLEGDVVVSHPDYIAIGVDDEVYPNKETWVKENLQFV